MEQAALNQLTQVSEWIRQRRSIKPAMMDLNRKVELKLLEELLENANYAPTHGLTEPWRFVVFQGDARQDLANELQACYRESVLEEQFQEDKFAKLGRNPLLAPVVIAIGVEYQPKGKIPVLEEIEAVACAVQNLHLSASAVGLGGFWASPPIIDHARFRQWLGLTEHSHCIGLFFLGWPKADSVWPKAFRRPIQSKVSWRGVS